MGKGDKKTEKGKRVMGSYGNSRKKKTEKVLEVKPKKVVKAKTVEKEATPKKPAVKKVAAKKTKTE